MSMSFEDFKKICEALGAPNRGWQKQAIEKAHSLGYSISQPLLSQLWNSNGSKTITPKVAQIMRALADGVASGDFQPGVSTAKDHAAQAAAAAVATYKDPDDDLTDEAVMDDISDRFTTFDECIQEVVCGSRPGCLVSGPPGCGKSHCVEQYEDKAKGGFELIRGDISPVNLFMALHRARDGGVVVFDDCDGVFADDVKLNLLKGALEVRPAGKPRILCWLKESRALAAEDIEKSFDFQGRVLFMTNIDFEREITRGSKLAPHLRALMDRSGYLSLGLHSRRRRMLRVVQVCRDTDIMANNGVSDPEAQAEILEFVRENQDRWRNLNLRLVVHLCGYRKNLPTKWKKHSQALLMKK